MSDVFISRLTEWATWYKEHQREGRDLDKELEFVKKAMDGMLELFACAAQDIHDLEGRPRESLGRKLWTPGGMTVRGDVRRFG